ncbi:MAG: hypothetical protein Q9159_001233 [Coniocarpon cinnabarinum]
MMLAVFLFGLANVLTQAASQNFTTGNWQGTFSGGSGVLYSLVSSSDPFDFSLGESVFSQRNASSNYHTGDLSFRWRLQGQTAWQEADSAASRATSPVNSHTSNALLHSDFNNVFTEAASSLNVTRDWIQDDRGDLVLQATLTNVGDDAVEIGSFGFPLEMNNVLTNREPEDAIQAGVFLDPYLGLDAGYVQVTRLTGTGPNMVITPVNKDSKFEAWRFLFEATNTPLAYQSVPYEGNYVWQMLSLAYAEQEWNATTPWNEPTSATLTPGQHVTFALRFTLSSQVYDIESTVSGLGLPVAVGFPGYIVPRDQDARLVVKTNDTISSIEVDPAGALIFTPAEVPNAAYQNYRVTAGTAHGRVRATITYASGLVQAVHYYVTDSALELSAKLGEFAFDDQWYTDTSDPFGRAYSVISYDYEVRSQVLQDSRVWIAGICDDGGAGSFEAASMKSSVHPVASEIEKLETMVNTSIWGSLQYNTGENTYGVKRSLFYYDPAALPDYPYSTAFDWGSWTSWNQSYSRQVLRGYNYVHVSTIYHSLYRAERANPGILTMQSPLWYLNQSAQTVLFATANADYIEDGLMCETVWLQVLQDLQAENMTTEATRFENAMRSRQQYWSGQADPFGSEQPWDSTGQEGVYLWSKYFGDNATVDKTLNSIRGYMPTVAHWGWNGNARRYWDFVFAGKLARIERMIHHYGSGLNALPLLDNFKYLADPGSSTSIYDLRVAYGGHMGPLSNINQDGFGSQAFHSYPETLAWEAYSADYGLNYMGNILGAATYLVESADYGWVSFGGNLHQLDDGVVVEPRDAVRRRVYVASMGLWATFDAGVVSNVTYTPSSKTATFQLDSIDGSMARSANMMYESTLDQGVQLTMPGSQSALGGFVVPIPGSVSFSVG